MGITKMDRWVKRRPHNTEGRSGIGVSAKRPRVIPIRKPWAFNSRQQTLVLYAKKVKGKPQVGLPAVYGKWGRSKLTAKNRLNAKGYRMNQIMHREGFGGTGLDEMVSTEAVGDIVEILDNKKRPRNEIENIMERLSREREEVRYLVWTTDDEERPLSGHPGSLSKSQTDMRQGLTGMHGDKNNIRHTWVMHEYKNSTGTENEQLEDTSIMASIMTNQLFSEPFAQTSSVVLTPKTLVGYHPVYGKVYESKKGTVNKTAAYRKITADAHNARERRKWQTAERLMRRGYGNLVHGDMAKWILEGQGWTAGLDLFMKSVGDYQVNDSGPGKSVAYTPLKLAKPVTLSNWATLVGNFAVGAPRPLIKRIQPPETIAPKVQIQKTLFDMNFFKQPPKL